MARNTIGLTSHVFIIDAESRFLAATRDATVPLPLAKRLPRDSCQVRGKRNRMRVSRATKLQIAMILPGRQDRPRPLRDCCETVASSRHCEGDRDRFNSFNG